MICDYVSRKVIFICFLNLMALLQNSQGQGPPTTDSDELRPNERKLLFILMDGFRWDYVDMESESELPAFREIIDNGVKATYLEPIFPSVSFPTWTSLVTGLYAESHGITGNDMYCDETKKEFTLSNLSTTDDKMWWTQEPIWITSTNAGYKTALHQWSRCSVKYEGMTADYCTDFEETFDKNTFYVNVQKAIKQFQKGYDFIQIYSEEPDLLGHMNGPDSDEVIFDIKLLDDSLAVLLKELKDKKLDDNVNIVIVSDHGMAYSGEPSKHFEIDDYLNTSLVEKIVGYGNFMNFIVPEENIPQVFDELSKIPNATVYKKEDMPEEWHYKNGKYVHDIFILVDEGYLLFPSKSEKQFPPRNEDFAPIKGNHGYNPNNQNMRGIFIAKGPMFEQNKTIEAVNVVDVYQALTNVLDINPRMNNGSWDRIKEAFKPEFRSLKPPIVIGASVVNNVSSYLLFVIAVMWLVV